MKILIIVSVLALCNADRISLREFTTGNREFTAEVYTNLAQTQGNFLLSPLSVEIALAVAQSGAKDETAEEIRKALRLPNSVEKVESIFKYLTPRLKGRKSYSLFSANKLYVQRDFPIKDEFLKTAREVYNCPLENVNFSQGEKVAETINNWVEKKTNNKIHDIINPSSINDLTKIILINTVYFKGEWWKSFSKYATVKRDFFKTPEEQVKVDMMRNEDQYSYFESEKLDAKFLKLDFRGSKKAQMVVVLPNQKDGLSKLEKNIDRVLITPNFNNMWVDVALPKFKIETEIDFLEILKSMGVEKAFGPEADLSGIAGNKGDLQISEIVQKTLLDVGEGGVEAVAATAVRITGRSFLGGRFNEDSKTFIADHPFLFYIKIKNVIVFAGRVLLPSS